MKLRLRLAIMLVDNGLSQRQAAQIMSIAEPRLVAYSVVPDFGAEETTVSVYRAYREVERIAYDWLKSFVPDFPLLSHFRPHGFPDLTIHHRPIAAQFLRTR